MRTIKLLVNFGYYRKQWIAPFEKLPDHFEIVYLFYIHQSQESTVYTDHKRVFWSDFSGARELLRKINPDRVVFMDVTSGLSIALNLACRRFSIPTFMLQHGLYHDYHDYRKRELDSKKIRNQNEKLKQGLSFHFSTLQFLKNSITFSDLWKLVKFPWFLYLQKKRGQMYACRHVLFEARKPDFYVCYTPENATIHRELDGEIDDRCRYIGNPELYELDQAIRNSELPTEVEKYYLLIDQPFADNRYGEHIKTKDEMIRFYTDLASWCENESAKLYVKLHPESFHSEWLPEDTRIEWVRESESLAALIANSQGCFGYFSTLVLPAICHRPTVLFEVGNSPLYRSIEELKAAQVLPFVSAHQIRFKRNKERNINGFINRYFYQTENNPIALLAEVLR